MAAMAPRRLGGEALARRLARRCRPAALLALMALFLVVSPPGRSVLPRCSAMPGAAAPPRHPVPMEESSLQLPRRAALGGGLLGMVAPSPAWSLFGLFDKPGLVGYTVQNAFNISHPEDVVFKQEKGDTVQWRLQRTQPLETLSARALKTKAPTLADAIGQNATQAGLRQVAQNRRGFARLLEAKVDPTGEGWDAVLFEIDGEVTHELDLYAMLQSEDGEHILASISVKTPSVMFVDREELFREIVASFKPLLQPGTPSMSSSLGRRDDVEEFMDFAKSLPESWQEKQAAESGSQAQAS